MSALPFPARRVLLWCLTLLLASCTDPYLPPAITSPPNYLVVDGFINSQGVTTIRLSRTYAIASGATSPVESKATLAIEDEAGVRYALREGVSGTYISTALTLNTTRKYRLHINTLTGKEYVSDFMPVKTTPPIDKVNWRVENTGLSIYVNAHDPANATQYYRWETEETWEINPVYRPNIEYVNGKIRDIVTPYPTLCWGTVRSPVVRIYKTTALSQDVVADFRVQQLPANSERLNTRYSILVQQQALSKEEFAYWELLRKNTESIGTLFDPQPAQVTGNVRCLSNTAEVALGFVSTHSLTESRIFIRKTELPQTLQVLNGYEDCMPPDTVYIDRPIYPAPPSAADIVALLYAAFANPAVTVPITTLYNNNKVVAGYTAKSRDCVDCRRRGTTVKPSFWP